MRWYYKVGIAGLLGIAVLQLASGNAQQPLGGVGGLAGKGQTDPLALLRNTSAQSYYNVADAVNGVAQIKQGDLLVWMKANLPLAHPGHVAVVQAMVPLSSASGNLRVVEATGAAGAKPKLLDSWYLIEKVISPDDKALKNDVMVLQVKRHGVSGSRVAVMRPK